MRAATRGDLHRVAQPTRVQVERCSTKRNELTATARQEEVAGMDTLRFAGILGLGTALALGGSGCAQADPLPVAVSAASVAGSCPKDRLNAVPTTGAAKAPPPDIAADPARLAIWQRTQADNQPNPETDRSFHISGCGGEWRTHCVYQYLPDKGNHWACWAIPQR